MSNRIQLALSLIVVILLVIGTNRIDKQHFEKAQEITQSVYEDRLVAAGYIYEMDQIFDEKKAEMVRFLTDPGDASDSLLVSQLTTQRTLDSQVQSLMDLFAQTRLTPDEAAYFEKLQRSIARLNKAEKAVYEGSKGQKVEALEANSNISDYLNALAGIQQGEGKRMTEIAQESLNQNAFMSQIEIALVILVGVVLQVVLFYRR